MYNKFSLTILATLILMFGINLNSQNIYTYAGNGVAGFLGDSAAALSAQINSPDGIAIDASGNLYITEYNNHRIRKVSNTGIITTIAGTGVAGYYGDGGIATDARLFNPCGIAIDANGNIYFADESNARIRKIDVNGFITTITGNGVIGYSGDGGFAINTTLNAPKGVAIDYNGNLYFTDSGNNRIRKVTFYPTFNIISRIAGNGTTGFYGDGGLADTAVINNPTAISCYNFNVYFSDNGNHRIRKINSNGSFGIISTIAGNGNPGFSGDGAFSAFAEINSPWGITFDNTGAMYFSDMGNHRIRRVAYNGQITTIAGNSTNAFSGDGGAAVLAELEKPRQIAVDAFRNVYFADFQSQRVRVICNNNCPSTVGLNEKEQNNKLLIYPNPNNGSFKFQTESNIDNADVKIYNTIGQIVKQQTVINGINQIYDLSKGLYHIVITNKTGQLYTSKIVVE